MWTTHAFLLKELTLSLKKCTLHAIIMDGGLSFDFEFEGAMCKTCYKLRG